MKQTMKRLIKGTLFLLLRMLQWTVIILGWSLLVTMVVITLIFPIMWLITPLLLIIVVTLLKMAENNYRNYAHQNIIIFGGRGKGKGLLFQKAINLETQVLSNIDYGKDCTVVSPSVYFESIKPNTFKQMIEGKHTQVKLNPNWEKVPYYLDDTAVYFPNTEDSYLKQTYKSMNLFIVIQRHLYNSYTVINTQSLERVYKNLRELQTDGYIKALGTYGKQEHYIWNRLPILRHFMAVKYRYYENYDSAVNGLLPFEKLGLINRTSEPLYTTTASALKEQYEGQNGVIRDGIAWLGKKNINYNTRYFKQLLEKTLNATSINLPQEVSQAE